MKKVRIALAAMALVMGIGASMITTANDQKSGHQKQGWYGQLDGGGETMNPIPAPSEEDCDTEEATCAIRYENDVPVENFPGGNYLQ